MREADKAFIMATWLRGLYYGDSWFSTIPKNIFMNSYKKVAQHALINPLIKVQVACLKEDQDVILGYSVTSVNDDAIVWIFVKSAWRQQGIGKSLLPKSPKFVTLLTELGKSLLPKLPNTVFNPFY
jgi:GNAT superfamily N-acetyltransferase